MIDKQKEEILKLINNHGKNLQKAVSNIKRDWKNEKSYPTYSNQYYAYVELLGLYREIKAVLSSKKKRKVANGVRGEKK